ncbi:MAG: dihydropteroate synthase [Phycisphaerales bacterium]|nr:dihydropteroate synthase [Phycisphaerales bacterium]
MIPTDFDLWLRNPHRPPLVMGVLNVTPDSFSDGGRYADPAAAVAHAKSMFDAGADLLDVGGESTRPGSARTAVDEQISRVLPVIQILRRDLGDRCLLSIDTTRAPVARAALDAGASIINDISAARDDDQMLPLAAQRACPIILMHMQGTPATMQKNPTYRNVVDDVAAHLRQRLAAAQAAGVPEHRILLDPGIGFGKAVNHNLELLRRLGEFAALGRPLVLGTSRKGFLARITGETDPRDRLFSTAASVAWCVANQAAIVRVHDVGPMAMVVRVIRAIQAGLDA